jgi:hypothetical protein
VTECQLAAVEQVFLAVFSSLVCQNFNSKPSIQFFLSKKQIASFWIELKSSQNSQISARAGEENMAEEIAL